MKQRKILVTGGAGFIGSNFVHTILESSEDVSITVVDKLTYAGNLKNLEKWKNDPRFNFIKLDITDKTEVFSKLQNVSVTEIAHFAAESHVDRSILGPEEFIKTNVIGSFYMLEFARTLHTKKELKVFLHVSTDEVFGSLSADGAFTETTPYAPNSPYSASKAGSDHLVRAYFHTYGLPVITTNCSNNYGPFHFPEKLIPLMILNCLQGKPLPVYGTGENIRDWLFVKDHCLAIDLVMRNGKFGETYNIGTRNEKNNLEIVHRICELMDKKNPSGAPHKNLIQFVKDRPGHDFRYAIDPAKIETELGWKPKYQFDEAIEQTVDWFLENKPWWEEILSGEYNKYYESQYKELNSK
ncbi:dTDP-glucose 4,6-dehydratase [Leptospira kanakyensis]|uniref:dTDP-glucose 4,6-dehydratase n=1 Tax=Leptospira kanakyensis TaxID=2484968 RepID=A0A6N4QI15_9LEPT|nr:dTDP-glucose 4,6-dehydratase [Leptospira kanakyensis]MCW7482096.1 dTDP-glucose 4,6-dehydratase [Leptospira kanakyensis]TGK53402.1 dTDP-glucose 4,6-dehydratase [Leptospira kanakyensis]TGK57198.1 dTDP-glucose 4,6-dehydratase [Leptospira kanakyensis]TGK72908.1 dTDP-glucose 4,6-dehydratase [Leptospira kanakyensis]